VRTFLARLAGLLGRRKPDGELDEELRFHLDEEAAANRRRGMTPEEADRHARRALGGVEQVKELYRERQGLPMIESFLRDARYGLRLIRRSPGLAFVAVLSLAIGIGANSAIFTVLDALYMRALPVRSPAELVSVGNASHPTALWYGGAMTDIYSYPLYRRLRDGNHVFSGLLAAGRAGLVEVTVSSGAVETVNARLASGNYFDVLGISAIVGRTFSREEDAPGGPRVAVISYDYWMNRLGGNASVVGRPLTLNGLNYTVVGIGPRGFEGDVVGLACDVWIPLSMQPQLNAGYARLDRTDANWLVLIGRLAPGVSVAAARSEITTLVRTAVLGPSPTKTEVEENRHAPVPVESAARGFSFIRPRLSQPLGTLMVVVGLVLLIACANIANLLLARASARQREMSVRLAVGASRLRLIRQLLTESVLLASAGGLAGLLLSWLGVGFLLRLALADNLAVGLDTRPDAAALAFTAAVSLLTALLFGLAPALQSTRVGLASALKAGSRHALGNGRRVGKVLVVGQVALSMLLLVTAGLFLRSLVYLEARDVGYRRTDLMVLQVDPIASALPEARQGALVTALTSELRDVPGVDDVSASANGLFTGIESSTDGLHIDGFVPASPNDLSASVDQVGPRYFHVLGVPILAGRDFDDRDTATAPAVAVVNETMARFYFGTGNPIGKQLLNGGDRYTIVGVVKDMRERNLHGAVERRFYAPILQTTDRISPMSFEIRLRAQPAAVLASIRRAVDRVEPGLKILMLAPAGQLMDQTLGNDRLIAQLCGFFGILALLLAAMGLYGLMAYATSRRGAEIGLRMALGAGRGDVRRMVIGEALLLTAAGLAAGVPLVWLTARLTARLTASGLEGVGAADPSTIGSAAAILFVSGAVASLIPAFRASRRDPMAALRQD